jgi:hypothetical protein
VFLYVCSIASGNADGAIDGNRALLFLGGIRRRSVAMAARIHGATTAFLILALVAVAAPARAQTFKTGNFVKTAGTAVTVQTQNSASVASGTTLSIAAFNPGAGSNRLLVVGISSQGAGGSMTVTFGGVALALVPGSSGTNGTTHTEMWYLVNPASSAATIQATWTGARALVMGAVAFNNVDQTTPVQSGTFATGTSTAPAVTITSEPGDMTMAVAGKLTDLGAETPASRWHDVSRANQKGGGSTVTGGATVTHTWTASATSTVWTASGVNVKQVGGQTNVVAHGLGLTPKAVIIWTEGETNSVFNTNSMYAFGVSDGTTSRSVAGASQNGMNPSNTARRMSANALTIVKWGEVTLAEATVAFDATNLTFTWTTNTGNAYVIHYLALGGTSVSAKVVDWTATASGSLTNKSVTGVGFQPNAVLHFMSGDTAAVPSSIPSADFMLGIMDPDDQWVTATYARDNVSPAATSRGQLTNASAQPACILELTQTQTVQTQAHFVSMDADGFTVHFDANTNGPSHIFSLALAGMNIKPGVFNKSTSAATPAFVQQAANNFASTASAAQTFGAVSTTGNLIVVSVGYDSPAATISSVTDSNGNTYTLAAGPTAWGGGSYHTATYYAKNITGGGAAITITVNLSAASTTALELFQLEYSGVDTVSPLDQASSAVGTGTVMNSGSKTTTQVNELIYGLIESSVGGVTGGATFTTESALDTQFAGDKLAPTIGSYSVDGTAAGSVSWVAQMVTFKGTLQAVTGAEFQPTAVFFASAQDLTRATPVTNARLGFGASDGTTEGSSASADQSGVATASVQGIDRTTKAFTKVDNNTSTVNAEADLVRFDVDGFTLNWTTNDAVATEILYLAFAPLSVTQVGLVSLTAARYDRGVLVQWRTGSEINNLGFNVYREVDGVRTKINASLIAGSGLQSVYTEQNYGRWDLDAAARSASVVYWLEDVDFNGTATLHGPVTPSAGGLQPQDGPTSGNLSGLGTGPNNRAVFFDEGDTDPVRVGRRDVQWDLAAQSAIKIGVKKPGWYRIAQADAVGAGLDPGVDPHRLRLFVDGIELAIRVTGEQDGRFDPADAVEFYGTGADTPSSDTQIYWLVAGAQPGLRIPLDTDAASGPAAPASFLATRQRKDRTIYFAALKNGDAENWFGPVVATDPTALTLTTSHIDRTAGPAQLNVTLQGVTSTTAASAGHAVGVLVNGTDVGEVDFQGQLNVAQTFAVPLPSLIDGENTVTLIARGGVDDVTLVDILGLRYSHTYQADADMLRFTADAGVAVTIGGFAGSAIRVVDITDPAAVIELQGTTQAQAGGVFAVTVQVPGQGPRTLLAFSDATVAVPASITANRPSAWHAVTQAHDYVVVSHGDFIGRVAPLSALRTQQGHRVAVVDIEDVYDEFSFGEKTPQALRDFLQWARGNWREAPRFVVLVGDATIDPRDYAGVGGADFVPTKQVPMTLEALETASDDWFVDFADNGLPDIAIGRLSVRSAAQADVVVGKIVGYDQGGPQPWTKNVLLVADQNDATSNFERSSVNLSGVLPPAYTAHQVFRGALGDDVAHQALIDRVNDGQLIVNYMGHGSVHLWGGSPPLLQNASEGQPVDDVRASWRNLSRLPFVVAMNCLNGLFDGVWDEESLAEALQRAPNGGAVAVWASSSVTSSSTQALVDQELFRLIFQGAYATLGETVVAATRVVANRDLRRSWIFFGDPAMHLSGAPLPVSPVANPPAPPPPTVPAPPSAPAAAPPAPSPEPVLRPGAPVNLTSSVFGSTLVLSWTSSASGTAPRSYVIEAGAFTGSHDFVFSTGTVATSFTANNVAVGTYFVRVRAQNDAGTSAPSNEVIVTVGNGTASPTPGVPGSPGGLTATVSGSAVTFAWAAPSLGGAPQTYWIDAGSSVGLSDLASFSTGTTATAASVSGVPAGTYYVRVRAANAAGSSTPSNEVVVFVAGSSRCAVPPDAPSALRSTVSGSTVTLGWNGSVGSPTSYIIEAGSQSGGVDVLVSDTGSTTTAMVARGVASGTYFVRIRARNACGVSGTSNETVLVVP